MTPIVADTGPLIEERKPLPDRATISLGDTKLLFVAFCGDGFTWSDA